MNEIFLLKLGEIILKGSNKRQFENKLRQNIRRRMKPYGNFDVYILQSTVYVGKSSVSYNIKGRYKTYLPIPVYKCEFGGKIVVAVVVNRQGRVIKAEVVDAESNKDDSLREVAVDAALKSEFNVDEKAPERQTGTITYNFVKQ